MHLRKRIVSLLLAVVLLAVAVPAGVFAAQTAAVTRAQWIQALVDTFDMTVDADNYPDNYYSDISESDSFYRGIMVAVEFGVIDLEAGLAFEPNEPATREFAAHTLNFCLGFQLDADAAYTFGEAKTVTYPDDIQVAVNRGWFSLVNGNFLPENPITAAEKQTMLQDAAAVLADEQPDTGLENAYQFAQGVTVLSADTDFTQISETVYEITAPGKAIAKGDVFVLFDGGAPLVFEAGTVSVAGDVYTVTVTPRDINEYLLSMDAQGSKSGDLKEFQVAEDLEALYVLENGTRVKDVRAAGTQKIKSIYFSKTIGNLSVSVELFDMKLEWQAKGNILDRSSVKVKAIVTGKTFCNASLAFGASVSDYIGDLVLGYCPIGSLGSVTVTANISVDGCITVSYGANFKTGVTYSYADGFRIPQTFQKTHFSLTVEATLDMSVTARAAITNIPMLYAQCYATVGMKANFVARHRGMDQKPLLCLHTDTWLYAKVGASATVGIESKLFGADTFKKSWSIDVNIWDRNTSPARSVSHFEDGVRVTSCAYGETNFFGYNSYYWSSLASRYGNGGVSAVANVPTYTYSVNDDGSITITGYSGGFAALSIPATIDGYKVTAIGENAFKNRDELISVTLPASVTKLAVAAFCDCDNLRDIKLPEGLLTIEKFAFSNDFSLLWVELPDSLQTLGVGAFKNCTSLQRVHIPKDMQTGEYCGSNYQYPAPFTGCTALQEVTFGKGITFLPNALFGDCYGLTSIVLPDTLATLNWKAFQSCTNLRSVTLPASLTEIGSSCFVNCTALTDITLPDGLQILGCGAFEGCTALQRINIPKNMDTGANCGSNYMYPGPFKNCSALQEFVFAEGITRLPNALFSECTGITSIVIPETVTKLHWKVFQSCANLTQVTMSSKVTQIDSSCFVNCAALQEITLPDGLQILGCGAFENCTALEKINIPKNMRTGDYCGQNNQYPGPFKNCSALKEVTFAEGVTKLHDGLFSECTGLQEITIPEGVTELGYVCFRGSSVKKITLPDTLTKLGSRVFHKSGLEEITIPDSVTSIGDHVLADCPSLKSANWPAGTTYMPDYSFAGSEKLQTVKLPDTLTTIHKGIFRSCKSLVMDTLPASVTQIGAELFYDCDALTAFTIPKGITTLSNNFFEECDSLQEIVIPDTITSLGGSVFNGCDSLTTVTMANSVQSIGSNCFRGCKALKTVQLSQSLTSIPSDAFRDCAALEQIVIPYRVTSIGNNAFNGSTVLTKVVTGEKLTSISSSAFPYADTTVFYGVADSYTQTWAKDNGYQFQTNSTPATSVTLCCQELHIQKGSTTRLVISVAPLDFTDAVVFKSGNTDVATVSDSGEVKAVGVGTATIKVTAGNVSASCKVTVTQGVTQVKLNKSSLSLEVPATYQLTATVSPSDATDKSLLWTSSDEKVAKVDQSGLVTAVGNGTAVITAAAQDGSGKTAACNVTVVDPNNIPVQSISFVYKGGDLQPLETLQMTAAVFPGNAANKKILWSSSDEAVVTVDENGLLTPLKKGTATITATAADGYGATASVTVNVTGNGYVVTEPTQLESAHNYPVNCTDAWKYSLPGSVALEITFDEKTDVEDGFDYLHIYDGNGNLVGTYTGTQLAGKTVTVPGDTVVLRLASDDSGTAWGFKVTQLQAAEGIPGDFDGNGEISVDDAIYLLQHVLMPELFTITQNADVDKNGELSVDDAIYLLQHVLMPDLFPL